MPRRSQRSRKLKRTKKRLPGGRTTLRYKRKTQGKAHCGSCGKILAGVSVSSSTKSKKSPSRRCGGVLCFNCLKKEMIEKARQS